MLRLRTAKNEELWGAMHPHGAWKHHPGPGVSSSASIVTFFVRNRSHHFPELCGSLIKPKQGGGCENPNCCLVNQNMGETAWSWHVNLREVRTCSGDWVLPRVAISSWGPLDCWWRKTPTTFRVTEIGCTGSHGVRKPVSSSGVWSLARRSFRDSGRNEDFVT